MDGSHGSNKATGSWESKDGGQVAFASGTFRLAPDVHIAGTWVVEGSTVEAGDIQGSGESEVVLWASSGTLDLTDALTPSHIGTLKIYSNTTLTGAGELDVSGSFSWAGGSMTGSGKTVLGSGVSGTIDPGVSNAVSLTERELVNEGTLTWSSGSVKGRSNAEIDNGGTLIANAQPSYAGEWSTHGLLDSDGSNVWVENTGTIKKTAGGEFTMIQFQIDNEGTIDVESGQLLFMDGSHSSNKASGSWESNGGAVAFANGTFHLGSGVHIAGTWVVEGSTVEAGDIQESGKAEVVLWANSGTLDLTDAAIPSHISTLKIYSNTTLTGAGTLDVSGSFSWAANSTMSGSGSTVLASGATGSIDPGSGSSVSLTERDFVNKGTLTWSSGSVEGKDSAEIDNAGTFIANASVSGGEWSGHGLVNSDGSNVWLHNTGTVKKTDNDEFTTIGWQIDNEGAIETKVGQIIIAGGGHGSAKQDGSWSGGYGAVSFNAGSYVLGSGVEMSGSITLAGGSIQAEDIQGPDATLKLLGGGSALNLTSTSTASHLGTLNIENDTTLTGVGTLDVSRSFWWSGGTMSGSGSTELTSSTTGGINPGTGNAVSLTERDLVNKGTLTWNSGSVEGSSNAEIDNSGTFVANASVSAGEWSERGLVNGDGSNVWLYNTGTVKKTGHGEFTTIGWQIDNEGTVESKSGQVIISGGGHGGVIQNGSWAGSESGAISFNVGSYVFGSDVGVSGTIAIDGADIQAESIQGPDATLLLWGSSTLDLTSTSMASQLGTLNVENTTTLTGAATLDVSSSFSWSGDSTMSGSGATVLGPSLTGTMGASSGCEPMNLHGRTLDNEGTLTYGWGTLFMADGARFNNKGTFNDNSETSCYGPQIQASSGSAAPFILNTGTFEKTSGRGTSTVAVNFSNQGVVEARTGTLDFSDGGIPEEVATGSWATQFGAHITLSGGTFMIGEEVNLSQVEVARATVEREPTSGPPRGYLNLDPPHSLVKDVVWG